MSLVSARLADGRVARFAPAAARGAVPPWRPRWPGWSACRTVADAPAPAGAGRPRVDPRRRGEPGRPGPGRGAGRRAGIVPAGGRHGGVHRQPAGCGLRASTRCTGSGLDGTGVTIGVYELEPYTPSDITAYETCYGISTSVTNTNVDGGAGTTAQQGEAALDIEDVIGLAPGATVKVFTGPQTGPNNAGPSTPTRPWSPTPRSRSSPPAGACASPRWRRRANQQAVESILFAEAAAQGQTVVAASGDSGSTDCYPAPAVAPR